MSSSHTLSAASAPMQDTVQLVGAAAAEDLSRMEGEYGSRMIGKLKQMDVLIVGLAGLGVETAKNLILAGPHSVTLFDNQPTAISDLGSNFYLTEQHVGIARGPSLLAALGELNPNVNVQLHVGEMSAAFIQQFDVVCVTTDDYPLEQLNAWNAACRARQRPSGEGGAVESSPATFLLASMVGCYGWIFADFGPHHLCFDDNGVASRAVVVDHISQAEHGVVTIDGDRHLLNDGDLIKLEEVGGMSDDNMNTHSDEHIFKHDDAITNINATHEIKTTKNPKRFTIGDTRGLKEYVSGGVGLQVKKQITFAHQPLSQQLLNPTFITGYIDFTKFGRDTQLHLTRLALWEFQRVHHALPRLHSAEDANELLGLVRSIAEQNKSNPLLAVDVDETVVRNVSLYARTELAPLCALFGGVLAQEITKQAGKYTPITQWFHFDAFELLSPTVPADAAPSNTRYDHQIAVFGREFQQRLGQQRTFLVGCGALGCEYLKQFAMLGLGCAGGEVTVTDDDRIELSNLSRQFLFRRKHVGLAKSISAGEAAIHMNPALKDSLKTLETRVEPKSENVFDDAFWDGLDFVVNALDNQQARKYTDGNIEWAREKFDDLFVSGADLANSFLEDRVAFFAKLRQDALTEADALKSVVDWLQLAARPSFDLCVRVILDDFVTNFRNAINDLTHNFPKDARNVEKDTGVDLGAFWHGHKRFPQAAAFDPTNQQHVDYVYHGANILASVFGLHEQEREAVVRAVSSMSVQPWQYTGGKVDMSGQEGENKEQDSSAPTSLADEDAQLIEQLTTQLQQLDTNGIKRMKPADFEKDVDRNHHIDFITASSNLRAWNYHIKQATRTKVRLVAGKIIPAIATTTAAITGFIGLELLKHVKRSQLNDYRACTINLATNVFCCENLPDPIKKKSGMDQATYMQVVAIPEGHTVWDKVEVDGSEQTTVQQLLDLVKAQHHGVQIEMLATPSGTVFYNGMDLLGDKSSMVKQRLNTPVVELHRQLIGPVTPDTRCYILFDSSIETDSGDAGIMPIIQFNFRPKTQKQ